PAGARAAVRVLHARHGDGHHRPALGEPAPNRGRGQGGPGGQLLPLHRLPQHRQSGAGGRRSQAGWSERVIPAPFDYVAAESAAPALDLLARFGQDAKLLAGGHSLLPMMKLRLATPSVLIDIGRLAELTGIRVDGDDLVIGAAAPHASLAASDLVRADAPLLAHSAAQVGDPQIRHRGTIGGSLAHADPAADLPMALVALGGSVVLRGADGRRSGSADDFFTGYFEAALDPGELLTAVRVPGAPGQAWGYQKLARRANVFAIVGAAA